MPEHSAPDRSEMYVDFSGDDDLTECKLVLRDLIAKQVLADITKPNPRRPQLIHALETALLWVVPCQNPEYPI